MVDRGEYEAWTGYGRFTGRLHISYCLVMPLLKVMIKYVGMIFMIDHDMANNVVCYKPYRQDTSIE